MKRNPAHRKARSPRPVRLLALAAAAFLGATMLASGPAATADGLTPVTENPYPTLDPFMTGRAFSIGITDTKILGAPVPDGASPDTGYVSTQTAGVYTRPCTSIPAGLVTATATCVKVQTSTDEGARSEATTSVATARVGVPGLPVVTATAVNATSASTCAGSTGSTTIAYLKVGTQVLIAQPTPIAPNTKLTVGPLSITLNEQAQGPNGLTVTAIHIRASVPGVAETSVRVSSAQSGVTCFIGYPVLD